MISMLRVTPSRETMMRLRLPRQRPRVREPCSVGGARIASPHASPLRVSVVFSRLGFVTAVMKESSAFPEERRKLGAAARGGCARTSLLPRFPTESRDHDYRVRAGSSSPPTHTRASGRGCLARSSSPSSVSPTASSRRCRRVVCSEPIRVIYFRRTTPRLFAVL